MTYTLLTGATGGLGRAFAYLLAERGEPLFLTARSEEKLSALKKELETRFGATVLFYPCALHDEKSREQLFSYAESENLTFCRLINVAGVDIQKSFEEYSQEKIIFQTRVNFEAAASLTKFVLSHRAEKSEILTISSVSGIYPMPYFAIYSATKSALVTFFSALREEWKGRGVNVTTVLPGAIPTRTDVCEQIKGQGLWGKLAAKSPEWVAKKSLSVVRKNKRTCVLGFWNKMMSVFTAPIPLGIKMRFIAKRWSKLSKDAF